GMRVAQGQRAEGHHPVDVLVAVDVVDARATGALHKDGILAKVCRAPRGGTAGLDQHAQRALVNPLRLFRAERQMDLQVLVAPASCRLSRGRPALAVAASRRHDSRRDGGATFDLLWYSRVPF